jgi:uncharacterized protein (TIGR02646 family)
MKRIIKKNREPEFLSEWKQQNPLKKYQDLQGTLTKKKLHSELLLEQYYLCCYCGTNIEVENSHVEHLQPQSKFKKRTLNYNNLLISCNGDNLIESDVQELKYCGHLKLDYYNSEMLTPLDEDCEERMILSADGRINIVRNEDLGASTTIDVLGLNSYVLREKRASIIDGILTEVMGKSMDDCEQKQYFKEELEYLQSINNGRLPMFSQELSSFLMNELDLFNNR